MPKDRININNERDRKSLFKQLFKLIINNLFIIKREETKEVLLTRNSLFFKPKREKKIKKSFNEPTKNNFFKSKNSKKLKKFFVTQY